MIQKIRKIELKYLKNGNYLHILMHASQATTAFLISTLPFLVFIYMDSSNKLTASAAFVSLTLLNIIKFPLWLFSNLIFHLIQCNVGIQRITDFLLKGEINSDIITHKKTEEAITFNNVDLSWTEDQSELILKELNFKINKDELVAGNYF